VSLERQLFPSGAAHALLLRLLLAQDGSTTRLCEAIAGQAIQVVLHRQLKTDDVPQAVREQLGGEAWLERISSLCCDGAVMMDNLSYTRLDAVPDWFLVALEAGTAPIGHLLESLFVKRERVPGSAAIKSRLWEAVGMPDDSASRSYRIVSPDGPLMLIFESYRAGMATVFD
jgi:chorismate-pyruvate lyase